MRFKGCKHLTYANYDRSSIKSATFSKNWYLAKKVRYMALERSYSSKGISLVWHAFGNLQKILLIISLINLKSNVDWCLILKETSVCNWFEV